MSKRIKLEFTELEINSLIEIIEVIESMYGSGGDDSGLPQWDDEMTKRIKHFDKMLKRNGHKR